MSLFGEQLIQMCEDKGAEDGYNAASYSPPVVSGYCTSASDAYLGNYMDHLSRRPFREQIEPNRRIVRRARMIALNKLLRDRRISGNVG